MRSILKTMALAAALAALGLGWSAARAGLCEDPVDTDQGAFMGAEDIETATCSWKGVPYAAPPVGELRFRAPRLPEKREGVTPAISFGPRCMQTGTMEAVNADPSGKMSEDCLYLNVWRPAKSGQFPVMVWIHGGGYTGGTGNTPMYWGDRMAEAGDVVVVTINYRLNVFGFMAHPGFREEDPNGAAGGYGSLDQVAAIDWVHRNIEGFGGDPGNVTIFGESAGGWSVCTMLATPLNQGRIHKAILHSGGCEASASLEKGYDQARKIAEKVRCDFNDLDCLREVPAKRLLRATGNTITDGFAWVPHHDGYLLTAAPIDMIKEGDYNRVPFIAGYNHDEVSRLLKLIPNFQYARAKNYPGQMAKFLGMDEQEKRELDSLYPLSDYSGRPVKAFGAMGTEGILGCPTYNGLAAAAEHQPETYLYRFDFDDMKLGRGIGAVHAMEIPFVFDSLDREPISLLYDKNRLEIAEPLSRDMQSYWLNFAKTGDPNGKDVRGKDLPQWPRFTNDDPSLMVFDVYVRAEDAKMKERCDFWLEYGKKYGAIAQTMGNVD